MCAVFNRGYCTPPNSQYIGTTTQEKWTLTPPSRLVKVYIGRLSCYVPMSSFFLLGAGASGQIVARTSRASSGSMTGTRLLCLCIFASLISAALAREPRGSHSAAHDKDKTHPLSVYWPSWMGRRRLEEMRLKEHSPPGKYYSQSKEDSTAENRYFHNLHGGVFLEMGALDGVIYSNTKFFEDSRGWRGLLIEPKEEAFRALAGNGPNSLALNAAVCSEEKDVHFVTHGELNTHSIPDASDNDPYRCPSVCAGLLCGSCSDCH